MKTVLIIPSTAFNKGKPKHIYVHLHFYCIFQVGQLEELNQLCKDTDSVISQLAIVSMTEVFKDIIPGYRIRLPTEAERNNKVWDVDVVCLT